MECMCETERSSGLKLAVLAECWWTTRCSSGAK